MSKLPVITARELARVLQRAGFTLARQSGSHAIYEHTDGRFANVPMHSGDIPAGTLRTVLKTALRNLWWAEQEEFGRAT